MNESGRSIDTPIPKNKIVQTQLKQAFIYSVYSARTDSTPHYFPGLQKPGFFLLVELAF
jgi:hypothetical protein